MTRAIVPSGNGAALLRPAPASMSKCSKAGRSPHSAQQAVSREAQRLAAMILEVLAGVRVPTEAADALDMCLPKYYLWEQRALAGLVAACEREPLGRGSSPQQQIRCLEKEVARLRQECTRQQALVRAVQRTIGLGPPPASKPAAKTSGKATANGSSKVKRKRRPVARALKAAAFLQAAAAATEDAADVPSVAAMEVLQRSPEGSPSPPVMTLTQFAPQGL